MSSGQVGSCTLSSVYVKILLCEMYVCALRKGGALRRRASASRRVDARPNFRDFSRSVGCLGFATAGSSSRFFPKAQEMRVDFSTFSSRTLLWSRANSGRRDGRMETPPAEESCGTFFHALLSDAAWSTLASPRRDGGSNRGEPTTSYVATSHPRAFADARCARESTDVDGTLGGNARGNVRRKFVSGSSAQNGPPATPDAPAALEAARRGRCSFPSRASTASGRRDFTKMHRRATR